MPEVDEKQARQTETAVRAESKASDETMVVDPHDDRTRELKTPGFSRMRTEWHGPDATQVASLKHIVDGRILHLFPDAFVLMNDLYDRVRVPEGNPTTGEVLTDAYGFPIWKRTESGAFIEDYSVLGIKDREDFLFRITTNIFEWRQVAADMWGEAMFSKAQWEEAYAIGFDGPVGRLTVDDRTNKGRLHSRDERYFAIFVTLLSKKADSIVASMELLGQRLKDTLE
jgi:hypothetical protein